MLPWQPCFDIRETFEAFPLGQVLERPISANFRIKVLIHFFYLPSYALVRETFHVNRYCVSE